MTDPEAAPLAHYFVRVEIVNEEGARKQLIQVRAPAGLSHTDEIAELGKAEAKRLGFVPTGWAEHS